MSNKISPIINAAELLAIYKSDNLVIVDVSSSKTAQEDYDEKHLSGALFIDLNTQLANIKADAADGGRHPLPTIAQFSTVLGIFGITPQSHVVVYDHQNGANAAARFWWMLKAIGHEKVQVLNGGFQEAEKAGLPINGVIVIPKIKSPYKIENWKLPVADITEVERVSQDTSHIVIDVRSQERYNGENEPIDLVAGHIPGAINIPFTQNLKANGLFLSPSELKAFYEKALNQVKAENIIVHCGSGVTACHTLLALDYAGLEIPKLYVGSWSEWSRNGKAIATNLETR